MAAVERTLIRPEQPQARPLGDLIAPFALALSGADTTGVLIDGVAISTDDVRAGDLYVALAGARTHGARYAGKALAAGASAILTDPAGQALLVEAGLADAVPVLTTPAPREILGELSAQVYATRQGGPKLFGITGTNGKTTTSYFLDGILRQLGLLTGMSTTVERRVGHTLVLSRLTTPEAPELHGLLARMREEAVAAVSLEVSAQALSSHRVDGLRFDVVGFTNLSHDHLDDFGDMAGYFRAKAELFSPARAERGVILLGTEWAERLRAEAAIPVVTVALQDSELSPADGAGDWRVQVLEEGATQTGFRLSHAEQGDLTTSIQAIGHHSVADAALALVMVLESGTPLEQLQERLAAAGGIQVGIPGRLERFKGSHGPQVYVDFAHSPDAIEKVLTALRQVTPGRLTIVFGASGDRDPSKRAPMAQLAARLADSVVITDHHSRTESPAAIRAALLAAIAEYDPEYPVTEVVPPEAAIRSALAEAADGDTIVWAGPGHLDYRDVDGVHQPFNAREQTRTALHEAGFL